MFTKLRLDELYTMGSNGNGINIKLEGIKHRIRSLKNIDIVTIEDLLPWICHHMSRTTTRTLNYSNWLCSFADITLSDTGTIFQLLKYIRIKK